MSADLMSLEKPWGWVRVERTQTLEQTTLPTQEENQKAPRASVSSSVVREKYCLHMETVSCPTYPDFGAH